MARPVGIPGCHLSGTGPSLANVGGIHEHGSAGREEPQAMGESHVATTERAPGSWNCEGGVRRERLKCYGPVMADDGGAVGEQQPR